MKNGWRLSPNARTFVVAHANACGPVRARKLSPGARKPFVRADALPRRRTSFIAHVHSAECPRTPLIVCTLTVNTKEPGPSSTRKPCLALIQTAYRSVYKPYVTSIQITPNAYVRHPLSIGMPSRERIPTRIIPREHLHPPPHAHIQHFSVVQYAIKSKLSLDNIDIFGTIHTAYDYLSALKKQLLRTDGSAHTGLGVILNDCVSHGHGASHKSCWSAQVWHC